MPYILRAICVEYMTDMRETTKADVDLNLDNQKQGSSLGIYIRGDTKARTTSEQCYLRKAIPES
jgi:hypothetical protein